jgi:hypothetical protein
MKNSAIPTTKNLGDLRKNAEWRYRLLMGSEDYENYGTDLVGVICRIVESVYFETSALEVYWSKYKLESDHMLLLGDRDLDLIRRILTQIHKNGPIYGYYLAHLTVDDILCFDGDYLQSVCEATVNEWQKLSREEVQAWRTRYAVISIPNNRETELVDLAKKIDEAYKSGRRQGEYSRLEYHREQIKEERAKYATFAIVAGIFIGVATLDSGGEEMAVLFVTFVAAVFMYYCSKNG